MEQKDMEQNDGKLGLLVLLGVIGLIVAIAGVMLVTWLVLGAMKSVFFVSFWMIPCMVLYLVLFGHVIETKDIRYTKEIIRQVLLTMLVLEVVFTVVARYSIQPEEHITGVTVGWTMFASAIYSYALCLVKRKYLNNGAGEAESN